MFPKQIARVLFNVDMKTNAREDEGFSQAGIEVLYFYMF